MKEETKKHWRTRNLCFAKHRHSSVLKPASRFVLHTSAIILAAMESLVVIWLELMMIPWCQCQILVRSQVIWSFVLFDYLVIVTFFAANLLFAKLTKDSSTENQSKGQGQGDLIPGECQRWVHHSIGHAVWRSARRVGTVPCQQIMSPKSDVLTGSSTILWWPQRVLHPLPSQGSVFVTRTRWT